ncbi:putative RNA-directed DNA polymerase [Lupinus albus]|uniref:Putative RNA-directed DNA polymerase n=1 Tax=Lupinus albus TaxID=3870 RepID=A0A6A4QCC9_LUPAL|nr:putative RNA-directed DNA polymerase [Lupinus albus]
MEIARSNKGILLYQRKYALDLLEEAGMLGSKPCSTPMEYPKKLVSSEAGTPLIDPTPYRRLIGKLIYLTQTRPDLSFCVGHLSQFLSKPTNIHFEGAKRILRYLKGSISAGIFFSIISDLKIRGYTDLDWAGYPDSRKSVSGYCFYLGNSLISWKSKKQQVVAKSLTEAEYRAMSLAASEAQWLLYLLHDLEIPHFQPVVMFCDNQLALQIAANTVFHERTKHIEVDCHFVRAANPCLPILFRILLASLECWISIFQLVGGS